MKNYYSTLDGIIMTFSDIEERNGFDEIIVRFERTNEKGGFDFAEGKLPENMFYKSFGFSENDEPVHIHVSKGKPHPNATKFWLKHDGIEMAGENTSFV